MTDEPTKSEFQTEVWTYAGRRYPNKGAKAIHEWVDGSGTVLRYMVGALVVGGLYEFEVGHSDTSVQVRFGTMRSKGRSDDSEQVAIWEAIDQSVRDRLNREKWERALAKNSELDRVLEPILRLAARTRTSTEMSALRSIVHNRITDAYYRKP